MISTLSSSPDPSPNKGSGGNWTEDACRSNGPSRMRRVIARPAQRMTGRKRLGAHARARHNVRGRILHPRPALHRFVREDHLQELGRRRGTVPQEQQRDRPQTEAEPLVGPIVGRDQLQPGSKQQSQRASRTSFDHETEGFGRPARSQSLLAQPEDVRQFGSQRRDRRIQSVVAPETCFFMSSPVLALAIFATVRRFPAAAASSCGSRPQARRAAPSATPPRRPCALFVWLEARRRCRRGTAGPTRTCRTATSACGSAGPRRRLGRRAYAAASAEGLVSMALIVHARSSLWPSGCVCPTSVQRRAIASTGHQSTALVYYVAGTAAGTQRAASARDQSKLASCKTLANEGLPEGRALFPEVKGSRIECKDDAQTVRASSFFKKLSIIFKKRAPKTQRASCRCCVRERE